MLNGKIGSKPESPLGLFEEQPTVAGHEIGGALPRLGFHTRKIIHCATGTISVQSTHGRAIRISESDPKALSFLKSLFIFGPIS